MKIKFFHAVLLVCVINLLMSFNEHRWNRKEILKYDISGYYLYLPATIIYKDLAYLSFYKNIDSNYHPSNEINYYALYKNKETGKYTNKYAIGTAIGELPFFLIAHMFTKSGFTSEPDDGYSIPYQFSVAMSNILWCTIGLLILGLFLKKYFSESVVSLSLIILGLGTNLYCYTNHEFGMSHTLVFMQFSWVLFFTDKWYSNQKYKWAILLGLTLGWVLITRPVDSLIALVPILWPMKDGVINRINLFWTNRKQIVLSFLCFLGVTFIQLSYWKYTTGNFLHFSYEEEGFNFIQPDIWNGLFSFKKGWFIYTPIAFICIMGLIPLYKQHKKFLLPIIAFLSMFIYIVFSWWMWWYGWGFGARPMIESYAVLSIPLAAILTWVRTKKTPYKTALFLTFSFFIWLNIYQTEQYKICTIHGDKMTQEYYWRVWNKMHPNPDDIKYLE